MRTGWYIISGPGGGASMSPTARSATLSKASYLPSTTSVYDADLMFGGLSRRQPDTVGTGLSGSEGGASSSWFRGEPHPFPTYTESISAAEII